jgi:DNA adenine methylase
MPLCKPLIKWVGGKSQLISQIQKYYPFDDNSIYKYVEPFVGGGAVLFDILNNYNLKEVYISDINADLINIYNVVKTYPEELISVLKKLEIEYKQLSPNERKDYFYKKRNEFNIGNCTEIYKASLFIFLNKTCFNGLYRVNKSGKFNVPHGSYSNPLICDENNIRVASQKLQNVTIKCADYKECIDFVDEHTFVYIDPPYRPISKTSSFVSYTTNGFNDDKQAELAAFAERLIEKGAKVLLSNSDPQNTDQNDDFFIQLYSFCKINKVEAKRNINCKGNKRSKIKELLISN